MQQDMIIKIVGVDAVMVVPVDAGAGVVVDMDMVVAKEIMEFNSRTQEISIRGKKGEIKINAKLMKQNMHVIVVVEDLIGHATVAHQNILLISIKNHLRRTKRWRQTLQVVMVIIFFMIIYLVRQILENMTTTPQLILMFLISSSKNK
jgi:hypothetical protein